MSKDDYYVIVYKLLSYLYSCLKKCNMIDIDNLRDIIKVDIGDSYWEYIIRQLYNEGYVEGVATFKYIGDIDERVRINKNFKITPKGIDFLESNSRIAKAKAFLKDINEILFWL